MKTPHKHAALMAEYAKDAAIDSEAFRSWQHKQDSSEYWLDCIVTPYWNESHDYRRKPKTININGHEVPEPERNDLDHEATYYYPNLLSGAFATQTLWDGDEFDKSLLKSGLVHLTEEAAIAHAKALLSFTETPEPK